MATAVQPVRSPNRVAVPRYSAKKMTSLMPRPENASV